MYVHTDRAMPNKYDLPKKMRWNMNTLTFYLYGMISMSHTDLMQLPPFRSLV